MTLTDPTEISEHFNDFFSKVGKTFSNSVLPLNIDHPSPDLEFNNIDPSQINEIIIQFYNKQCSDPNGISISLLRKII